LIEIALSFRALEAVKEDAGTVEPPGFSTPPDEHMVTNNHDEL
jgi:hypothetical protein